MKLIFLSQPWSLLIAGLFYFISFCWWYCHKGIPLPGTGATYNMKTSCDQYRNSHWWDKMILRLFVPLWKFHNTLEVKQNGLYFIDNIFKFVCLNENVQFFAHWGLNKKPTMLQITFFTAFPWKKILVFFCFNRIFSQGSNWQKVSIDSVDGLELNRQQAIIWTNVEYALWRHMSSLAPMS